MIITDDPLHDFQMQDSENEEILESHPCCEICGERIDQEDAVMIPNYGYVCDGCLESNREDI